MTAPDLIHELRTARPTAPPDLRGRVRELAAAEPRRSGWSRPGLPRRTALIAVPAAAAVALAGAGILGFARSDVSTDAARQYPLEEKATTEAAPSTNLGGAQDSTTAAPGVRAQQVSATLTLEVRNSDEVSSAAQDALMLMRSLGGYVVNSSVTTGSQGNASLVVRVPVGKVQEAIVGLSGLGRIVSQQVNVQDLQETLDQLQRREAGLRTQIARIRARLNTETFAPETEAALRSRLQALRTELVQLRAQIAGTNAAAAMSTIQLTIVTPEGTSVVAPPTRLDRTIDEALNVLAWEGVVVLGVLIVMAPFATAGLAVWLGRRLYRRHEEERLLAT
jgi:hypothetical protein